MQNTGNIVNNERNQTIGCDGPTSQVAGVQARVPSVSPRSYSDAATIAAQDRRSYMAAGRSRSTAISSRRARESETSSGNLQAAGSRNSTNLNPSPSSLHGTTRATGD